MLILPHDPPLVHSDPEDARWWANENDDWHSDDGPAPDDPIWDVWAEEAAAREAEQRGC